MTSVNFATASSGPMASSIGWFDFTGVTLNTNSTLTLSNSLPNGGNITFNITNTNISGSLVFSGHVAPQRGGIPFGSTNYTGIAGMPLLNATAVTNGHATISINNLSVTNSLGQTIPFGLVVAEGEGSVQNESITCSTDGSPWRLIANIYGSTANITGINTTTISWGGANPWPSPVVSTNTPTNIFVNDFENSNSAIALGVILTPISVQKYVSNRLDSSDQFTLSIAGPQSSTTITSGVLIGTQPNTAFVYAQDGGTYILNESIASGSLNTSAQYTTTVSLVNLALNGTTIPSNWTLGTPITVQMGDSLRLIITNTPIIPHLTISKFVSASYSDLSPLTYSIVLTNTYPNMAINTVLLDTTPTGTTFISGSLTLNNTPISGTLSPPNGLYIGTIPANSTTTITYQVLPNTTPTITSPVKNSAVVTHSYTIVTNTPPTLSVQSNITTTTINSANLVAQKLVSKLIANVGDILTYTIPITNLGNTTAYSITFIDSIPFGTSFISNSFKQDNTIISGIPNPPGIILPTSLTTNKTSTVTFQVLVLTTPNLSQIPNVATITYSYLINPQTIPNLATSNIAITNTVVTNINGLAYISLSKLVDKIFATCGDTLTYTIILNNLGNTTAANLIFSDTIQSSLTYIGNSFKENNNTLFGANLSNGINLSPILPGNTTTLTFQATINC